ncbi:Mitochondrial Rho GTPase 2 [Turnera subulata]|uniref:Mitochondrial Rho GTPase n=1 Tax=Turnera subulata TaxID=218843 RepID=A0A9Q0G6C7_9ROSI|nr:Mitochondrial Rho GTPase 2 [Turnera subulata]
MPGAKSPPAGVRTGVRVVVAGERYTGKSSLIAAAASESFPESVPHVLPPTRLPADFFPDRVPITIIDTSGLEIKGRLIEELKRADAVVLTYACDQPQTLGRLCSFWLEELRRLQVKAPVVVVGCKLDLRDENEPVSLEHLMGPIMQRYREIETCIECSAVTLMQVPDAFYFAQRAVLHPTTPLFDQESQSLRPRCVRALRRIFILCDRDMDGTLNDEELNEFQVKCFNAPLQPEELIGVRRVVQEKKKDGVNDLGLTFEGFLYLHSLFIEKSRPETTWTVLRKFGYNDDLKLRDDFLPVPVKRAPDQSIELAPEAVDFLRRMFQLLDVDNHGALHSAELDELFSTAPENPLSQDPFKNAAERTSQGHLTLKGFLSEWALMTLLNPKDSLANLLYLGYGGNPSSAFRVTRKRTVDRKKQQTERNVFRCLVLGPDNSGKSALLNSFLGRSFLSNYDLTSGERYAANTIDQLGGTKKTLILQEIPEDGVKQFFSSKESLAACDVAIFVHDGSDELSWKKSTELLVEVTRQGEESGFGIPCLLVAAKDDLDPYHMAVQDSVKVCQELGVQAPIRVSMKLGEVNNLFHRILIAAECPHLNIPETQTGKRRKNFRKLINHSLLFMSVGAAVAFVGVAAFRAYAARKNTSS